MLLVLMFIMVYNSTYKSIASRKQILSSDISTIYHLLHLFHNSDIPSSNVQKVHFICAIMLLLL